MYELKPAPKRSGCLQRLLKIGGILLLAYLGLQLLVIVLALAGPGIDGEFDRIQQELSATTNGVEPKVSPKPSATRQPVQTIRYETLARYTEEHVGKRLQFQGKAIQVVENSSQDYVLLVNVTYQDGFWEDTVLLICTRCPVRPLVDDVVNFVGTVDGRYTYETLLGASNTVPQLTATSFGIAR